MNHKWKPLCLSSACKFLFVIPLPTTLEKKTWLRCSLVVCTYSASLYVHVLLKIVFFTFTLLFYLNKLALFAWNREKEVEKRKKAENSQMHQKAKQLKTKKGKVAVCSSACMCHYAFR